MTPDLGESDSQNPASPRTPWRSPRRQPRKLLERDLHDPALVGVGQVVVVDTPGCLDDARQASIPKEVADVIISADKIDFQPVPRL